MRFRRADLMAFVALLFAAAAVAFSLNSGALLSAQGVTGAGAAAPDAAMTPIAPTFSYQGVLRDAAGKLITGQRDIKITIWDAPVGGAQKHSETFTGVQVRDGVFNVVLGDATPLTADALANTPRYISIKVGTDPEMTPRQRLHPVPWALRASSADTANSATTAGSAGVADTLKDNATTNGLTVNGAFQVQDLKLNGAREITNRMGTPVPPATPYVVNARRWIVETDDQDSNFNPPKLDENRLGEYCIDEEGCRIWIGMRNWASASNGNDLITFSGPFHWSISKTSTQPGRANQRFYEFHDANGNAIERDGHYGGWDGDGSQWLAMSWRDCHLRDNAYVNGVAQPDSDMGFYFLNTESQDQANDMTCVLIIED